MFKSLYKYKYKYFYGIMIMSYSIIYLPDVFGWL